MLPPHAAHAVFYADTADAMFCFTQNMLNMMLDAASRTAAAAAATQRVYCFAMLFAMRAV